MADVVAKFQFVADYEAYARKHLPAFAFEFYADAAGTKATLERNLKIASKYLIVPRVLRNVSSIDISCSLLGGRLKLPHPIGVSPAAFHALAHPDGEKATAKGCEKAGALMILSQVTSFSMEEVAAAAPNLQRWMNVLIMRDRSKMIDVIRRAEAAGYGALVVTVDYPALGKRNHDFSHGYQNLILKKSEWFGEFKAQEALPCFAAPDASWDDVKLVVENTRLPVVVKGIMHADDARKAVEIGVSAVMVSNHGGRQLDCCISTIEVLPSIVAAVGDRCDVYIDGGIRTGTDAFKAISLGAKAVFVARPILWGLATNGSDGVAGVLSIFRDELSNAMMLSGCRNLAEVRPELVWTKNHIGASKL